MSSSRSRRQDPGWRRPLLLLLRLLLMGVGLGVISGSALKMLAPQVQQGNVTLPAWLNLDLLQGAALTPGRQPQTTNNASTMATSLGRFETKEEITALSQRWRALAAAEKDLQASAFLLKLDDGRYAELSPDTALPAASSIKTPILLVALELLDAGDLSWNEPLTLSKTTVGGGAGWMASKPLGSRFPTHEVATEMIRVSDNTATNLLIERVGGKELLNQRFNALGLSATVVNNWLPDLEGTNTTSARDLARSIALVDTGEVLSTRSRDLFREVMGTSRTNRLLPGGLLKGLGGEQGEPDDSLMVKGYRVLNKTGDIGIAYADAGLIELPDGSRAVAAFLVKGPFNDPRSTELIRSMAAAMAPVLKPKPPLPRKSPKTVAPAPPQP
ncbi:serine hydrolase [Synechococcus sp. WH 8101]|uniref:serine hydrolase n=1 Tax=Synechococcus sp. WH 8101 TaxID=59932 RepID=UPI0010234DFC|nr:serine hydrolase [Synechococcus sp. WH 8101]QBE68466.1 serine hydrolase [Synechococcus sp. WH 8101]QNI44680.1 beta-lactamase class A [Synechococcus sp. WH 8101]